jgi:hypothetical protein
LGLVPDYLPNWMNEDNGLWVNNKTIIADILADFIQNWLEDNINPEIYSNIEKTEESIKTVDEFENDTVDLFTNIFNTRLSSFEEQLTKIETI